MPMIPPSIGYLEKVPELKRPLSSLKGIGSMRAEALARRGLHTLLDVLCFIPLRYEDRSRILPIDETEIDRPALVRGKPLFGREESFSHKRKRLFRIHIADESSVLELIWFQYKKVYLGNFLKQGQDILAYGTVRMNQGKRQMIHPDIRLIERVVLKKHLGLLPVYPAIKGVPKQVLVSAIQQALELCRGFIKDAIPEEILTRLGLPSIGDAISSVHIPPGGSSPDLFNRLRTKYHQRFIFDRFLFFMLNITFRKLSRKNKKGPIFQIDPDLVDKVQECFPFKLTNDQLKAIKGIYKDLGAGSLKPSAIMNSARPMNRLLQGDVGCGKTVVAAAAAYAAVLNGWQVAIMAPTLVLGRQHFDFFRGLTTRMGFHPVLLTGELKGSERAEFLRLIKEGEFNLIIGTQALIQKDLIFARLGLVIIDEQHRFGVRERALLDKKGIDPHLLIMSATPIPRTLALTVYADLKISVIKQYPKGRQPVKTLLVDRSQKRRVFSTLKQRMSVNEQAIVICPVIQSSEDTDLKNVLDMYKALRKLFAPRYRVALIHGRLTPEEKNRVMHEFREGLIDLLVGTTVIEVGIHAEGATVMVVEHPERFGITQLHQLRGRVGRGEKRGLCLLMMPEGLSDETCSRLKVLTESNDGFEIARKDLEMRGQGELTGLRQAGLGELDFMEVFKEPALLMSAKREGEYILASDPALSRPQNRMLREMIRSSFTILTDF